VSSEEPDAGVGPEERWVTRGDRAVAGRCTKRSCQWKALASVKKEKDALDDEREEGPRHLRWSGRGGRALAGRGAAGLGNSARLLWW